MLSRPPTTTAIDRLVKVTLLATLASLGAYGALLVARTSDRCACNDHEHGRITKYDHRVIADMPRIAERVTWATWVLGYSTQYSEESWSAQQALGAPNVFPRHGDIAQAWASKTADEHDEWIELGYDEPRPVSAVEIYETFNPGAISTVELITTSGRRIELRPASLDVDRSDQRPLASKTSIPTPCTSEPIAAVRINLSSTGVEGWNEIDAVGLVACSRE